MSFLLIVSSTALRPLRPSTHPSSLSHSPRRGAAALLGFGAAAAAVGGVQHVSAAQATPWAYSTLLEAISSNIVEKVVISSDGTRVMALDVDGNQHETGGLDSTSLIDAMRKARVSFDIEPENADVAGSLVEAAIGLLPPLVLLGGLLYFAQNQMGGGMGGSGGPMGFAKSRSEINLEPNTGVTFDDVAGCDQSKLELNEVVDFLKKPAKYSALGAKVPRGVLMEGPPGTGKTLLARAVAGEAGVPFVSCSGSEFVEMFVGVGASRVRDLFTQAKKNAPCIVFIDEIDAVGRTRPGTGGGGTGGGGGNDEREQTLNQILTEMDGFDGNSGVIVIAATNRGDILDPALLRPGRFDRRVPVDLPDRAGRQEILGVHAKGKPLAEDVTLAEIASRTTGMSGASLANLLNEAAIMAARRNKTSITYDEVDYALDRLTVGMQKSTGTQFPDRQRLVAVHEAGHAVMGLVTPLYDAVTKVTIIPRSSGAGGFTLFTPSDEQLESGLYSKRYLQAQLAVALGGRVAEEIVYGEDEVTTGASGDLQQVRNIARRMVAQWGFTADDVDIGLVAWESPDATLFTPRTLSDETERVIDREVIKMVEVSYAQCKAALTTHRPLLDQLVAKLLIEETVNGEQMLAMLEDYDPALYKQLGKTSLIRDTAAAAGAV